MKRSIACRFRALTAVVASVGLFLAACSGGDEETGDISSQSVATDAAGDGDGSSTTAGGDGTTGTTVVDGGTTTTAPADDDSSTTGADTTITSTTLAGEDFDGFPVEGDVLSVVGVAHDDELNVRAGPGTDQGIVAFAAPEDDDVVATGRARLLPSSIWYEVEVDSQVGWVGSAFVAFRGGTDDATAEFLDGGAAPSYETMVDMAEAVAADFGSDDPPSRIVQVVAPEVGDVAEITYDVIDIADDAVLGFRLHIFATEDESGESFTLRNIERTTFCTRGLAGELCR